MRSAECKAENTTRPGHHRAKVLENRTLSGRYFLMVLTRPAAMQQPRPGTFIHLRVPDGGRFFLRRPFSVLDCDETSLSLIVVEKGEGTRIMRRLPPGTDVDFIGPLGSAFPAAAGKRVVALGGGVGLAPLFFYGRSPEVGECESFRLLYGARSREDLFLNAFDWVEAGVGFASDDGSFGFDGTVVGLAEREIERSPVDVVFSCGPNPMLRAAADLAARHGLRHYVSLENHMACAMGACRSCVVAVKIGDAAGYRTVCRDGPVFDADELVWKKLPGVQARGRMEG